MTTGGRTSPVTLPSWWRACGEGDLMSPEDAGGLFLQVSTYPIELFYDAVFLKEQATAAMRQRPDDGRNPMPTPSERALSRAAVFTAFNFLESLLIELSQDYVTNGAGKDTAYAQ